MIPDINGKNWTPKTSKAIGGGVWKEAEYFRAEDGATATEITIQLPSGFVFDLAADDLFITVEPNPEYCTRQ